MSVQPKRWTFAALTGRIPPFFMVRRRRRWRETVLAIRDLEGLVGVTPAGPVMMVHMETENDAIIAKNRLRFLGIPVIEETHETDIKEWGVYVSKKDGIQSEDKDGTE